MNASHTRMKALGEIERFLGNLENRVRALDQATARAVRGIGSDRDAEGNPLQHLRFSEYVQSRELSSECWAFSIVIERRIDDYTGPEKEALRDRFDQLTMTIWATLLECSLVFLDALSREEHLPLGSREIFIREIKTLYDAHNLLNDPRYAERVNDEMRRRQHQAERILTEIIERAPALLELGR